jgi:hypothetical protein
MNADAVGGAPPFHFEPPWTTISLSEKAISSVLRQRYNLGENVIDERTIGSKVLLSFN